MTYYLLCSSTDVRQQLTDQLKCLDSRLESHVAMLGELQEFYKRRSEVELEYSRGMDKLVKQIMARHKADKQRYVYI
jgi:SLIT-ROBO Rho GTPase activating protein